eukprot:CCRYP_002156-RB/>CCRYP_002156-RB protein AED:0.35 eAED:0.59 QI:0/0/0/1/0/0/2/0/26
MHCRTSSFRIPASISRLISCLVPVSP